MGIARILAAVSHHTDGKTVFDTACRLGVQFGAAVNGCYVKAGAEPYNYFIPLDGSSALQAALMNQQSQMGQDLLNNAHAAFKESAQAANLASNGGYRKASGTWTGPIANPAEFGHFARLYDLIVVAQPRSPQSAGRMSLFDSALFSARRSIFVASDRAKARAPESVAIAYNGSAESARAVTCALPFLRLAKQVNVITSGRVIEGAPTAHDLIAYLAAHGIAATHRPSLEVSATIENTILSIAHVFDADLLVMGAYTHSHIRERILGGVTRFMLEHADISLLMAH